MKKIKMYTGRCWINYGIKEDRLINYCFYCFLDKQEVREMITKCCLNTNSCRHLVKDTIRVYPI